MELTQEYFDKGIGNVLEKVADVKADVTKLTVRVANIETNMATNMATKDDLKTQTIELKQYVTESFETQQVWIDSRFEELIEKYDVRERVHKLEKDVQKLKLVRSA